MKTVLGNFSAKAGREDIFELTTGNENYLRLVILMVL
jgi:hypothetical protein